MKSAKKLAGASKQPAKGREVPAKPAMPIPPLVARLDATREAVSRGRTFSSSADLINELRDERMAEL